MSSINKVILIGNLGADPEANFMKSGEAVVNFRLATSLRMKDKETGGYKQDTEWHRVVCYGKPAEYMIEYTKKGSKVYIEGRLKTRKWTDKDGVDRYTTEIVASVVQGVDSAARTPATA